MKNFEMALGLVDGSAYNYRDWPDSSARALIRRLWGAVDEEGPPPVVLTIRTSTADGKLVEVYIPFDDDSEVIARVKEPRG